MAHGDKSYFGLKPPRVSAGEYLQRRQREHDGTPLGTGSVATIMPLPRGTYRIGNRGFGHQHHPTLGYSRMHGGHDIQAPHGTPILAPQDGVISNVLPNHGEAGNFLKMRGQTHGFGFMHMSRFAPGIQEGTRVKQGQIIGFVGSTGESSGPHLHYEVYSLANGERLNPRPIALNNSRTITQADARSITQGLTTTTAIFASSTTTASIQPNANTRITASNTVWRMHAITQ